MPRRWRGRIPIAGRSRPVTLARVAGWFADLFRLAWGLLYWNTRKAWFQWRRGRARCPCQNPSDSGRAYRTGCEACIPWNRPERFRRVCPLLEETPDGLRCSANAEDVRPFWGVAFRFFAGVLAVAYVLAVLGTFGFLRTIGYPVNLVHVALPHLWPKVGEARGWFFVDRANRAFSAGRTSEGMLYLANAYEFDPGNFDAGFALAKNLQATQPVRADEIFQRLRRDHPDKRDLVTQDWFRALLARGDFEKIVPLAQGELIAAPAHAAVWMRALLFATRHTGDSRPLRTLHASQLPNAVPWRQVLETELLLRSGRTQEARSAIDRPWPTNAPPFALFYRVNALIEINDALAALDLLARHPGVLDAEATVNLRLDALADRGARALLQRQVDELLGPRLNVTTVKLICAHLIRHPDTAAFERLWTKAVREPIPFRADTAGAWFSLLCAAGAAGDRVRLAEVMEQIKAASGHPFAVLDGIAAYFRGETVERRVTLFLPMLPLPLEVTYAMLERYAPVPAVAEPLPPSSAPP